MAVVTMKQLLESGVHFGHATRRWDPRMAPYIFTSRNGIHIIDLKLTQQKIEDAYVALNQIVKDGGTVLFVGTKKQAQMAVREEAARTGMFYVDQRWLGGTLTNFKTIRRRIKRLHDLYKMEEDGTFEVLPKKEVLKLIHERNKLEKFLGGIKDMKKIPDAIFIVDPKKEINAILEARKLHIPVFGIVDTNCNPDDVDFIIPANDDAIRAVNLITRVMGNAIIEAQGGYVEKVEEEDTRQDDRPRRPRQDRDNNRDNKRDNKNNDRAPKREYQPKERQSAKAVVEKTEKPAAKPAVEKPVVEKVVKPAAKKEVVAEEEATNQKVDYNKLTVTQLKDLARELGLSGYSTLRKAELIELLTK